MKKSVVSLIPLLLCACSNNGDSPAITLDKLYVNNDSLQNYAHELERIPLLKVGDKIAAELILDGNGSELKTFKMDKDEEMDTKLLYQHNLVSDDKNLTDEEKGQLRFQDGVIQTNIVVKATVTQLMNKDGSVKLSFYLSSKAEREGAQQTIDLKIDPNH